MLESTEPPNVAITAEAAVDPRSLAPWIITGQSVRVRRKFPRRGRVRPRWLRPWSLVSAAALTGLWVYGMVDGPGPDPGWIDYVALSAFALPFIMADLLLGGRWYVNLRDDGVTVAHFWGSTAVPWRDIEHWPLTTGAYVSERSLGRW